jgi:flagellar basal body-associated protein FliL
MKSKLKFIVPIALVAAGGAYKFALATPAPAAKHKIEGQVYVLPKEFLLNLRDGRFAKLSVSLVLDPHQATSASAGGHGAAPAPPEGFGTLPQEAVIRDLVTDELTGNSADALVSAGGRRRLKTRLLTSIRDKTDVKVDEVLFTDVAVQ